jgi:hypothetical protein
MAMGDEGSHATRLGEGQGLAVGLLDLTVLAARGEGGPEGMGLIAPLSTRLAYGAFQVLFPAASRK